MEDKISVIVPIYKVEKYLKRCIDSIRNQTYKNLQIILVDDGSPDQCGQICDDCKKIDNRIAVIHKSNGGLSDARNMGLSIADGEYITYIDSDDYISHQMIEILHGVAVKEQCKVVQCEFQSGTEEVYTFPKKGAYIKLDAHNAFETRETKVCVCGKLYHSSIAKNAPFRAGRINEDEFYTYQRIYESGDIILYRLPLYYYFQQSGSIMHRKMEKLNTDIIEAYDERIEYFKAHNEPRLVDISIKEKCIRETILYFKALGCEDKTGMTTMMKELFRRDYSRIKNMAYSRKEKFYLTLFNIYPLLTYPIAKRKFIL